QLLWSDLGAASPRDESPWRQRNRDVETGAFKSVADDRDCAWRQLTRGGWPHKGVNAVRSGAQRFDQRHAQISGASGYKYGTHQGCSRCCRGIWRILNQTRQALKLCTVITGLSRSAYCPVKLAEGISVAPTLCDFADAGKFLLEIGARA